jgi:hypothetical protein
MKFGQKNYVHIFGVQGEGVNVELLKVWFLSFTKRKHKICN